MVNPEPTEKNPLKQEKNPVKGLTIKYNSINAGTSEKIF